jgi:low affinity Fe/Cu permease
MHEHFRKFARTTSNIAGSPWMFTVAVGAILLWAFAGPFFGFSTSWQLVVNTGTTILTFLMVFLIQNTQNRDAHAVHLKLDELIKAIEGARNQLIDIEDAGEEALTALQREYRDLRDKKSDV